MEVKIDKNRNLIIKHKLGNKELYKISNGKNFKTISIYRATQLCQGYSSKTEDNRHILLFDWDGVYKSVVLEDIRHIQKLFSLPPAYLLTTKQQEQDGQIVGNFHAVILSKHTSREAFKIMGETNIDSNFRDSPIRKASRSWVLRNGSKKGSRKPKFLEIIGEENLDREVSSPHKKLISKFFPKIKHPKYSHEDTLNKIYMQVYETKS